MTTEAPSPVGWESTTLGGICEKPQYGWTTKAEQGGDGVRLLRTTDITRGPIDWSTVPVCKEPPEDFAKYRLRAGDVVVSRAGSVGYSALLDDDPPVPSVFASYLIRMRPKSDVEPRFVKWFMQSPGYWRQISDSAAGIAVQNVNAKKLAAIEAPLPPIDEQRRIVEAIETHISHLDAGVESLKRARTNLGRIRSAAIATAFEHVESAETMTLGEVARWGSGGTPKATNPAYYDGDIPWAVIGDLNDTEVVVTARSITPQGLASSAAKWVEPGTVLVAMYGSIGKLGVAGVRMTTNQAIACAVPDQDLVSVRYLFWFLRSQREALRAAGKGATQSNISQTILKAWPIPVPSIETQERMVASLETTWSHLDRLGGVLSTAERRSDALRASLLSAAFSGNLVSPVEVAA